MSSLVPGTIADGQCYEVVVRPPEDFMYKVVALNHPHQASKVVITKKKECVKWILDNLRGVEKAMQVGSPSDRSRWEEHASDLRKAADIITRFDQLEGNRFVALDIETASVVSRALLCCGKADVKTKK